MQLGPVWPGGCLAPRRNVLAEREAEEKMRLSLSLSFSKLCLTSTMLAATRTQQKYRGQIAT